MSWWNFPQSQHSDFRGRRRVGAAKVLLEILHFRNTSHNAARLKIFPSVILTSQTKLQTATALKS